MPPKPGRPKKTAAAAGNASENPQDASQFTQDLASLPAQLPQDLNIELSFEDQSTPKNGAQVKSRGPKKLLGGLQPQKRGPGRPPAPRPSADGNTEPAAAAATTTEDQDETPTQGKRTRRKRGSATGEQAHEEEQQAEKHKRAVDRQDAGDASQTADQPRRKPGRPPKSHQTHAEETQSPAETGPLREGAGNKRKRGRPSLQSNKETEDNPAEESEPAGKRKRGRKTSKGQEEQDNSPKDSEPAKKRPRGRPSLQGQNTTSDAASEPAKKRPRGRPSLQGQNPTSGENTTNSNESPRTSDPAPAKKRGRKPRTSDATTTAETSNPAPRKAPAHAPLDEREADGDEDDDTPPSPTRNYRHISSCLNSIPLDVVESTWTPLEPSSIPLATSLLTYAERPVLDRLSKNVKRRDHATFVLRAVSRNVTRRLSRQFPFPPANASTIAATSSSTSSARRGRRPGRPRRGNNPADPREAELDYEQVISTVKSLEKTLSTLQHGNRLLETEKAREERALEREYAELDELEANARSEARGLRESLKKSHALVPAAPRRQRRQGRQQQAGKDDLRIVTKKEEDGDDVGLEKKAEVGLFEDLDELGLGGLDAQLGNHMESLRANLRPVEGVVPEILQSRAALRDVLVRHLQPQRLEDAVLE